MKKALAIVLFIPLSIILVGYLIFSSTGQVLHYGKCNPDRILEKYGVNGAQLGSDQCSYVRKLWLFSPDTSVYFGIFEIDESFMWGRLELSLDQSRVMIHSVPPENVLQQISYSERGFNIDVIIERDPMFDSSPVYVQVELKNSSLGSDGTLQMSSSFDLKKGETLSNDEISKIKTIISTLLN